MDNGQKLQSIIATILGISEEQVTDQLSSETVDTWDSLNHINLINALEQEFNVTLATSSLAEAQSVAELKTLLARCSVQI